MRFPIVTKETETHVNPLSEVNADASDFFFFLEKMVSHGNGPIGG